MHTDDHLLGSNGVTPSPNRRPSFLIIGAMKAGTTSLYRWLESTDLVAVPTLKEPDFFTARWGRGLDWYFSLFQPLADGHPVGEASVSYSDPAVSEEAALRIKEVLPSARLIFIARNPIDRLRSHYRHEVQRNRETRPFAEAVSDLNSSYVRRSLYGRGLAPFLADFSRDQILVVDFLDLIRGDGFGKVLTHLGLPAVERPLDGHNITADKRRYTSAARWLFERDLTGPLSRMPATIRRVGRVLGTRADTKYQALLSESETTPVPHHVLARVTADVAQFEQDTSSRFAWELE
jgi:Sulfotransferase domain